MNIVTEKTETRIAEIQAEINKHPHVIHPRYPYVLVRVLPKERKVGTIIMPDSANKPIYEGVVVRTWPSFEKHLKRESTEIDPHGWSTVVDTSVWTESSVKPGDHVLFNHFVGIPLEYDDWTGKHYRLIAEFSNRDVPGILAVLEHKEDDVYEALATRVLNAATFENREHIVTILRDYDIAPRDGVALTLSGAGNAEMAKAR